MPGIEWFQRFKQKYPHIIWLNPAKRPQWSSYWSHTYDVLADLFAGVSPFCRWLTGGSEKITRFTR